VPGSCHTNQTFYKTSLAFWMIVLSKIETFSELRLFYARGPVSVQSCDNTYGLRSKSRVTVELHVHLMWLFEN